MLQLTLATSASFNKPTVVIMGLHQLIKRSKTLNKLKNMNYLLCLCLRNQSAFTELCALTCLVNQI